MHDDLAAWSLLSTKGTKGTKGTLPRKLCVIIAEIAASAIVLLAGQVTNPFGTSYIEPPEQAGRGSRLFPQNRTRDLGKALATAAAQGTIVTARCPLTTDPAAGTMRDHAAHGARSVGGLLGPSATPTEPAAGTVRSMVGRRAFGAFHTAHRPLPIASGG